MRRTAALLLIASLALPWLALAQQPPPPQAVPPSSAPDQPAESIDASKLGVSLDRIRRGLRQTESQQNGDSVLKLTFHVEVFGQAPKIDLLKDFPLVGPVPYGAPTHQEVLDFLTPQEFRSPVIPFSTIAIWAAQKLADKSRKARCEQELEEYRRLVMQGIAVAAPRCAQ